ncbi:YbaB/EbfC family nucleoid-associated protein [bacterium]|nr:YbaB/EbfC family nucleoid-associated protein [bacterium]
MSLMNNIGKMNDLRKMQAEIGKQEFTASSKDGKVKITINGNLAVKKIELDPEIFTSMKPLDLQKSLTDVINRALSEAKVAQQKSAQDIAKKMGINIPGM